VFQVYIDLLIGLYLLVIDTAQMLCSTPLSMSRHSDVRVVLNHVWSKTFLLIWKFYYQNCCFTG